MSGVLEKKKGRGGKKISLFFFKSNQKKKMCKKKHFKRKKNLNYSILDNVSNLRSLMVAQISYQNELIYINTLRSGRQEKKI